MAVVVTSWSSTSTRIGNLIVLIEKLLLDIYFVSVLDSWFVNVRNKRWSLCRTQKQGIMEQLLLVYMKYGFDGAWESLVF